MASWDPNGKMVGVTRLMLNAQASSVEAVAAVAGKKIRVVALVHYAVGGTSAFKSGGTDGTVIMPPMALSAAPMTLKFNEFGWFETLAGENLFLSLSATDANSLLLFYILV